MQALEDLVERAAVEFFEREDQRRDMILQGLIGYEQMTNSSRLLMVTPERLSKVAALLLARAAVKTPPWPTFEARFVEIEAQPFGHDRAAARFRLSGPLIRVDSAQSGPAAALSSCFVGYPLTACQRDLGRRSARIAAARP